MTLIKIFFNEIMYNDKISINYTGGRGGGKTLATLHCIFMLKFKKDYPILCKIPYLNWFLFKRYLNKKFKKYINK